MDGWLRFIFGLEENEVPAGAESRVELTGLLHGAGLWVAVIVVLAAAGLIVVLYRTERDLGVLQRLTLGALRLVALAIVVFMLLDPRILTEIRREREAHTIILFDTSASMSQVDEYDGAERYAMESATGLDLGGQHTRADLARAAMEKKQLVELLSEKNRVRAYAFDGTVRALEKIEPAALPAPAGEETRIGDALRGALRESAADLVAALILVSDGRQNAGEALGDVAPEAALRGVPVHSVAVGKSRLARNYSVTDLSGPEVTEQGHPIRLEARIEASGLRGSFKVILAREPLEGGARQTIDEREIEGKGLQVSTKLTFVDTLESQGTYRYIVSIPVDPAEIEPDDNERDFTVRVADEKMRVLLLAGTPTYEYRHLRNFLIRDDGLQVSCWLSSADRGYPQDGDTVIRALPQTEDKLREYDVLVLLDPDPTTLTPDLVEAIRKFVIEQGGGLAYVAGESYWEKVLSSKAHAKLVGLLPIEPAAGGSRQRVHSKGWKPKPSRQGADHPLCRFDDDPAANARLWSILPPLFYLAPTGSLRPVATSLLERGQGEIVAATQRSGAGYTVFIATDDLWRWRSNSPGTHERFWAGVVRYLALGKRLSGSKEAAIVSDRDRYTAGEEVVLEASVIDAERKPVVADRLEVSVEKEAEAAPAGEAPGSASSPSPSTSVRLNLLPMTGRPGWFSGRFLPEGSGRFVARVQSSPAARATFSVVSASREWEDPTPDPAALEDLARRTGGAVVGLGEIERLAERIPDRRISEVIGRTASTIWDSGSLLFLFCALMISEWILRKIWRLN